MVNKFYQKHKERLRQEVRERYQNLSEEEKDKRRKKVRDRYKNLPVKKTTCVYEKTLFST